MEALRYRARHRATRRTPRPGMGNNADACADYYDGVPIPDDAPATDEQEA